MARERERRRGEEERAEEESSFQSARVSN